MVKEKTTYAELKTSCKAGTSPIAMKSAADSHLIEKMSNELKADNNIWLNYFYYNGSFRYDYVDEKHPGDPLVYTNWVTGYPKNAEANKCVVEVFGTEMGWKNVHCDEKHRAVCAKDAQLEPRSCETFNCENNGTCRATENHVECKCKDGYGGLRCEDKLSDLPACNSYQRLKQPLRDPENHYADGEYCDTALDGWYRFDSLTGTKIHERCMGAQNRCGGAFPGWLEGGHPGVAQNAVERTIHFYRNTCDTSKTTKMNVKVRHCGQFYSYYFEPARINNCNLAICSSH